jgi:hypothetical protein
MGVSTRQLLTLLLTVLLAVGIALFIAESRCRNRTDLILQKQAQAQQCTSSTLQMRSEAEREFYRAVQENNGQNPRVFFNRTVLEEVLLLIVSGAVVHKRVAASRTSWLSQFPNVRIVTDTGSPLLGNLSTVIVTSSNLLSVFTSGHALAQDRFGAALLYAASLNTTASARFRWVLMVDDDAYVSAAGLTRLLPQLSSDENAFYGNINCGGLCGGGGVLFPLQVLQTVQSQLQQCGWQPLYDTRLGPCLGDAVKATHRPEFFTHPPEYYCTDGSLTFACPPRPQGIVAFPVTFHYVTEPHQLWNNEKAGQCFFPC